MNSPDGKKDEQSTFKIDQKWGFSQAKCVCAQNKMRIKNMKDFWCKVVKN